MKKINFKKKMMVLSKRKIAAVICTALLATAGVINYVGTKDNVAVNLDLPEGSESYDEQTNYGEARYVSTDDKKAEETDKNDEQSAKNEEEKNADDTDIKNLTLEKSRSEAVSLLQTIASSDTSSVDKKAEAQTEIIRIARDIEKEAVVTELLKAKGFSDVSVYMNSPGATVSVKSDGLSDSDLAKIRDTMKTDGNILPQNLKIIEKKQ